MTGHAELADHEDVERRVQRASYFISNGHASPGQAQHQDAGIVSVTREFCGELPSCVPPIQKLHRHTSTSASNPSNHS